MQVYMRRWKYVSLYICADACYDNNAMQLNQRGNSKVKGGAEVALPQVHVCNLTDLCRSQFGGASCGIAL